MEMDQLLLPPRIDHEVADHKMEKIEKKLEYLMKKRERLAESMQHSLNLAATACAIFVAILGFVVRHGNKSERIKCSLLYLGVVFVTCGIALAFVLLHLSAIYFKKHQKLFIVKLKRNNLKKKRDLLQLGKRQGKIPNDDPKFYLIGQLSKMEIIRLAERNTARASRFVMCFLFYLLLVFIGFIFMFTDPCKSAPPNSYIPQASGIPFPPPFPYN